MMLDTQIIERLIELAISNVNKRNKPFSCIIAQDLPDGKKEVLIEAVDNTQYGDPTATAVMVALNKAAEKLNGFKDLKDYEVYLLAYPDPMSLAALYHSTPKKVNFLLTLEEYSHYYKQKNRYYSSIEDLYKQIKTTFTERKMPMEFIPCPKAADNFKLWHALKENPTHPSPTDINGNNSEKAELKERTSVQGYLDRVITLSKENVKNGGSPFACLIVKKHENGTEEILAEAVDEAHVSGNPTYQSEVLAIRKAIGSCGPSEDYSDCDFYMLSHPCPMGLAVLYMVAPGRVIFSLQREDFTPYFQNKGRLYSTEVEFFEQFKKPWNKQLLLIEHKNDALAIEAFKKWETLNGSHEVKKTGFNDKSLPAWGEPNYLRKLLNYPISSIMQEVSYAGDAAKQFLLATRDLNQFSRAMYKEWNHNVGNNIFPLIIAFDAEPGNEGRGGTFWLYLEDGTISRKRPVAPIYEIHKNVSHLALGMATIVSPYFYYPKINFSMQKLLEMQKKIGLALTTLQDVDIPSTDAESYGLAQQILSTTNQYLFKWLESKSVTVEDVQQYGKTITPLLEKSAELASTYQMEAMINALLAWKKQLGHEEWRNLHAVVPTVWPVSSNSPRELALRHVMDPVTVDTNLIIAEGAKNEEEARIVLARTKDKGIAHLIFGGETMEARSSLCSYSSPRDLLSDAAEASIKKLVEERSIPPATNAFLTTTTKKQQCLYAAQASSQLTMFGNGLKSKNLVAPLAVKNRFYNSPEPYLSTFSEPQALSPTKTLEQ